MLSWRHLCLVFALGAIALAQSAGHGVIAGTVIDSASGDPVRKAIVTVTWHGTPRSWATLRTSSDGRFRFENLPAGTYDLRATKTEIGNAVYGANRSGELPGLIRLEDGETRDGLRLRFIRAATISGHVFDSDGDPARGMNVWLMRTTRNLGERVVVNYRNAQSNDRGEYRIFNIDAGTYYVSAAPLAVFPQPEVGYEVPVGQFYGGTTDWKSSTPLTIHGGETVSGIDFHLSSAPLVHLRGRIEGLPAPEQENAPKPQRGVPMFGFGLQLQIFPVDGVGRQPTIGGRVNNAEQSFEFGAGPAGRYRIEASAERAGKTYAASETVDVQPGTGDIVLTMAPAADVQGRLRIEGSVPKDANRINIGLTQENGRRRHNTEAGTDGHFTLKQVPPGEWALNVAPLPRGAFLKSAMLGDKDVRFSRFEIESGSGAALEIVVSMHSAKIFGEVEAAGGSAKRAGILVAPAGQNHDLARFYYAVPTDEQGKFRLAGIAPGKYKIFAVEGLAAANFRSPEAADALNAMMEGGAPAIDLGEDANVEVHPKPIPMERAREALP